jgi:UDP-2,4-diacetamido-2,4,6-trideoxy-beta-L-altropyranose hydrolase
LARSGHRIIEISSRDLDGLIVGDGFDLAIVDHYQLDASFDRQCRILADRVLVIDDLANRPHDCDFLLDPTLGRTEEDYRSLLSGPTKLLLGPAYALLDSRFFERRLKLADFSDKIDRAFVSFGAVDAPNLCGLTIAAFRNLNATIEIDVAVGSASPNINMLRDMATDDASPAHIVVDSDEIPALMAAADFAVGAAGGTGWERCCLGLPSLIITIADNQRENAAALQGAGAAKWLSEAHSASPDRLAAEINSLVADRSARALMRTAALAITDGLGANRAVSAVEGPLNANDGRPVSLRRVEAADCESVLACQSAPGARRYARISLAPEQKEHSDWFARKRGDPRSVFSVVLHDGKPAGVLRYDWQAREQSFEISILISSELQGYGIATAALSLGRRLLPEASVIADVDPANNASVALFKKAGYRHASGRRFILSPADFPQSANSVRKRAIEGLS